jgi:hypothetical protein
MANQIVIARFAPYGLPKSSVHFQSLGNAFSAIAAETKLQRYQILIAQKVGTPETIRFFEQKLKQLPNVGQDLKVRIQVMTPNVGKESGNSPRSRK